MDQFLGSSHLSHSACLESFPWFATRSAATGQPGRDSEARCQSAARKGNLRRHTDTAHGPGPQIQGALSRKTSSVRFPGERGLTGTLNAPTGHPATSWVGCQSTQRSISLADQLSGSGQSHYRPSEVERVSWCSKRCSGVAVRPKPLAENWMAGCGIRCQAAPYGFGEIRRSSTLPPTPFDGVLPSA